MHSFLKFLSEEKDIPKPLKTDVAVQLPGQVDMFLQKDSYNPEDVDPTLSGQRADDNHGVTDDDFKNDHPIQKMKIECGGLTQTELPVSKARMGFGEHCKLNSEATHKEDAQFGGGYVFPQDETGEADKQAGKRADTLDHSPDFSCTTGGAGRTESTHKYLHIEDIKRLNASKCPVCGSKKFSLMPTDFETAKCNNPNHPSNESRLWNHGIKEMADYAIGLGATDSQYSGSIEKNKLRERVRAMHTPSDNNSMSSYSGGTGVSGNLPDAG